MNLLIVSAEPEVHGVRELVRAANELGVSASVVSPHDEMIAGVVQNADRVIFRLSPKLYETYRILQPKIERAHGELLAAVLRAFNKAESNDIYVAEGMPIPHTVAIKSVADISQDVPSVIKLAVGHKGSGVMLARTADELKTITDRLLADGEQFLQQEYIEESSGSDKRLFVVGDKVIAAIHRQADGDEFRANLALGGSAKAFEPSELEQQIAVKALKIHELPFGGVDLLDSDRGPLLLEVNPSPGFKISEATGTDVAKAVIEGIIR